MAEELYSLDPARMGRIADELTAIRQRGLEEVDSPTGGEQDEDYPEVQALAEAFLRAWGVPIFSRGSAITYLLQHAVPAYGQWGNESDGTILAALYFDPPEETKTSAAPADAKPKGEQQPVRRCRPRDRLEAARQLRGLDAKRFNAFQRQLLLRFAPFLVGFVAESIRDAATQQAADAVAADPAAPTSSASTSHWTVLLSLLLAAGLVATALVLAVTQVGGKSSTTSPSRGGTPVTITGYAKCAPDATKPVVGVWIVAANGGSGWADWHTLPGHPNVAWFSRTLPNGGGYVVHVGCGGTPAHWELALASLTGVLGSGYTFTCYDVPPAQDPSQARCQP